MNASGKIVVAGAGLVGSLLAIYLQKRGYSVTVVERRPDMRRQLVDRGRSINLALSTRGIRALEEVGLADVLRQSAIPMHGRIMHDVTGQLSFLPYGKEGQFINSVSRSDLNKVLMTAAEKRGAHILFEHKVTGLRTSDNELELTAGSEKVVLKYDILIGADGAYSAVREALQFPFDASYIEHGYKELHIPAGSNGSFLLEKNALHIWPRESFMLIALPNPDGSFTGTLFFSLKGKQSFESLQHASDARAFFKSVFHDALDLVPDFDEQWNTNPVSTLVTMRGKMWSQKNVFLIGDAAHAIVPFYGQGMNAGFEDCRVLNQLLNKFEGNWSNVIPEFVQQRQPDALAIAQLALDNFIEMRDLVADADFLLRKKIESKLNQLYPDRWVPLYSMVTFRDDIRYSDAYKTGQAQKQIMDEVMSRKGIFENWQQLDFEEIVSRLKTS